MGDQDFATRSKVLKVDDELGLVFGWGIVCKVNGEPYYDTQGDHIPEAAMLKAATNFAIEERHSGEMHEVVDDGLAVFLFPLTDEVAAAYEISCAKRGLMVAIRPSKPVFEKFRSGEYSGFSIGGERLEPETVVEP